MKRFIYLAVSRQFTTGKYAAHVPVPVGIGGDWDHESLSEQPNDVRLLNFLGGFGWELAAIDDHGGTHWPVFFFKMEYDS